MNAKMLDTAFKFTKLINTDDDIEFKRGLEEFAQDDRIVKQLTKKREDRLTAEQMMTPDQVRESKSAFVLRERRSNELIELRSKQDAAREEWIDKAIDEKSSKGRLLREMLREAWQKGIDERYEEYGVSIEAVARNHQLQAVADAARACYENDDFITDQGEAANVRDQALGEALSRLDAVNADRAAFEKRLNEQFGGK